MIKNRNLVVQINHKIMKKILLTFAFVIVMTISASAQFKPFQLGLKIEPGIGWSKLNSDHLYDGMSKMDFGWGFVGNLYLVENYGISTGFNVRFMNSEYKFDNTIHGEITRIIKNQYFEIPIGIGAFSIVHSATTSFLSLQINNPMVSLSSSPFIK